MVWCVGEESGGGVGWGSRACACGALDTYCAEGCGLLSTYSNCCKETRLRVLTKDGSMRVVRAECMHVRVACVAKNM